MRRADGTEFEFIEANFTEADLSFMKFDSADVTDAIFLRARIHGADLAEANGLTQAQLNQACGDAETQLPHGLRARICDQ